MKNIILIFILLISSSSQLKTQSVAIDDIKSSTLLIRLATNEHLINHHINNGDFQKAESIRINQKIENQQIISAFQQSWSSCKVYFFYSHHTNQIKNKQLDYVFKDINETQLNDLEKKELVSHRNKLQLIIGYFGQTRGALKFNALVLMNHQFKQFERPMPKHVRTYKGLWFLKRTPKKVVEILEKKIIWHYSK
ncbi:MAG: hypothetical protein CMD23_04435 [Flavobacteriales bacterium]|nr:hypothetical protein [Flavobacteriales bacterium]|tara:strand:+ start:893 stop:1474 length:582 start_codon:yes stop_codon:yes gene_type:complete